MASSQTMPEGELWQRLNAYVDGELAPADEAEMAALIAKDRELASMVATLTQLKATTATSLPDAPPIAVPPPRRSARFAALAAASLVVLLGAGAGFWWFSTPPLDAAVQQALVRHEEWAANPGAPQGLESGSLLIGLERLGREVEVPDLSDSGLHVARVKVIERTGGAPGLHVAYVGSRGCRVSLVIEQSGAGRELRRTRHDGVDVATWAEGTVAYTLLASGMYGPRFDLLTASTEQATRQRRPPPEPVRQALREQRDLSPPCVG